MRRFLQDLERLWADPADRIIGHVDRHPPIGFGVGVHCQSEDWALVAIDRQRLPDGIAPLNRLNLRVVADADLAATETGSPPQLPPLENGMLRLSGVIPEAELHTRMTVLKRGKGTKLTLGLSSPVQSYVRTTERVGTYSREWPIYGHDGGAFAAGGDSGAIVVDRSGRIGGIVTAGQVDGEVDGADITYVTPMWWLLERMIRWGIRPGPL